VVLHLRNCGGLSSACSPATPPACSKMIKNPGAFEMEVTETLKKLMLKDLRIQCRSRGLNPGGGKGTLVERLKDHILSTKDT
jgi:hypothetical protein